MKTGTLYIVSAPSGAGKTSLIKALLETLKTARLSISYTTRKQRPGEEDGVHYHFVSSETFTDMLTNKAFLEHAEVFGNYYGTSSQAVQQQLETGDDVILEIDWQGARQVRKQFSDNSGIFILPPGRDELNKRLSARGQDNEEIILARMQQAVSEISHYHEYDYVVINDDFDVAVEDLLAIFRSGRLTLAHQQQFNADILRSLEQAE
ncbi:MAG: guanylate kinase [Gammaproteobacteria bacterium]